MTNQLAVEALKRERDSTAAEAQRTATAIGNSRETLKGLEENARSLNAKLLQLDAAIKHLS